MRGSVSQTKQNTPLPTNTQQAGDGSMNKALPMYMSLSSKPDMVNLQELAAQLAKMTRFSRFSPSQKIRVGV